MTPSILDLALALLGLSLGLAAARVLLGPTTADRAMALEVVGLHLIAVMGVWSVRGGNTDFFDAMLALAVVSFVGTLAIANYLVKGIPIDADRR
ncbi:monovalent cation/H+ antiporter complex subunit F [Limnochorda pilosa]|uniref:Monovalent cation/H+ antiporter subunit F n=1 Tax=Limnochorda pilosa TaxID=1555112 RepID=A0A0K2SL05_LIMPI|nr:monovalent cation/H+ antiporter complex subunit F [Limnochorda pilosa]BAS27677.1 monovalent cation/H+ antiporter subunit F [Limnochorda pilosa]